MHNNSILDALIPIITIDGPSGAGKGTVSSLIADELGWHLLDSGAIYRAAAYYAMENKVDLDNEEALAKLALHLPVKFMSGAGNASMSGADGKASRTTGTGNGLGQRQESDSKPQKAHGLHIVNVCKVYLDDHDVTKEIRTEKCGAISSKIAKFPKVREALLAIQRSFIRPPGLVADGRDMGTVVFPDAKLKFFLDASIEERAKRRYLQLKTNGLDVKLATITNEVAARDKQDRERVVSPLKPAGGAIIIDTTHMDIQTTFSAVMSEIEKHLVLV